MSQSDLFPLTPDYAVARRVLTGLAEATADSGRRFARLKRAPRLVHELEFRTRPTSEKAQLQQWYRRFERDWFSFHDPVFAVDAGSGAFIERYFSVEFLGEPAYELAGNEAWNLQVQLVDRIGAPLFQYPDPNAGHESVFLEETQGVAAAGTWTDTATASAHGAAEKSNPNTNVTDAFAWTYGGYGFRLWSRRGSDLGIAELFLDGSSLGTVDLYAFSDTGSQPVFTKLDVPLGLHVVKLAATNTRNAASSDNAILADALEVMI